MITLYLKIHRTTKLKYFGKTSAKDVCAYPGSGTRWKLHLKKHGNNVKTIIVAQYQNECFGLIRTALRFSRKHSIVRCRSWANLMEENGLDGVSSGTIPWNKGIKGSQKAWNKGISFGPMSDSEKLKRSKSLIEKYKNSEHHSKGKKPWNKGMIGAQVAWNKGTKAETKTCPHCNKEINAGNYTRWHGDNCKSKVAASCAADKYSK